MSPAATAPARSLAALREALPAATSRPVHGRVVRAVGSLVRALLPDARIGELCRLEEPGRPVLLAEVVGLDGDQALLSPIGDLRGLGANCAVVPTGRALDVPVGEALLGRVLDGLGRPLDAAEHGALPHGLERRPCHAEPPHALHRARVSRPIAAGVRAIDGLLTCGEGQRVGIYGEPGAGKSTLLGQLVRNADADVVVVALVGERGREVREFIEHQIDGAIRRRCVLVVATSDRPAIERIKAAMTATTVAEWFRDQGRRVLLVVDSVTRYCRALREIGLAAGEPPTRRGFPPSVLSELPRLLERAGPGERGSITAFYTVLVEGDGSGDPVAEETRGILDGHIVLSPTLAAAGHYPAIDVLASHSRLMDIVATPEHRAQALLVRQLLHRHSEIEFLVQVGEYRAGADERSDRALARIDDMRGFLRQGARETGAFTDSVAWLSRLP
ncbi:MAG: FliI/YscN family ATPase [Janthinobacterium lividum]